MVHLASIAEPGQPSSYRWLSATAACRTSPVSDLGNADLVVFDVDQATPCPAGRGGEWVWSQRSGRRSSRAAFGPADHDQCEFDFAVPFAALAVTIRDTSA